MWSLPNGGKMNRRIRIIVAALCVFAVSLVPSVAGAQDNEATQGEATQETLPESTSEVLTVGTESETTTDSEEGAEVVEPTEPSSGTEASTTSSDQGTTEVAASSFTAVASSKVTAKKKKRASASRKCSTSGRASASQLVQERAPVAAGCTRNSGGASPIVLPDGTTLTFVETSQGEVTFTVSGGSGSFTGTIFVKGGPESLGPGFACVFNGATSGTCHAHVNPNNGKFYGVSHIDACPGQFVPPGNTPGNNPGSNKGGGGKKDGGDQADKPRRSPAAAGAAVAAQPGDELPFTGQPILWLLLLGSGLLGSGAALRLTRRD